MLNIVIIFYIYSVLLFPQVFALAQLHFKSSQVLFEGETMTYFSYIVSASLNRMLIIQHVEKFIGRKSNQKVILSSVIKTPKMHCGLLIRVLNKILGTFSHLQLDHTEKCFVNQSMKSLVEGCSTGKFVPNPSIGLRSVRWFCIHFEDSD